MKIWRESMQDYVLPEEQERIKCPSLNAWLICHGVWRLLSDTPLYTLWTGRHPSRPAISGALCWNRVVSPFSSVLEWGQPLSKEGYFHLAQEHRFHCMPPVAVLAWPQEECVLRQGGPCTVVFRAYSWKVNWLSSEHLRENWRQKQQTNEWETTA